MTTKAQFCCLECGRLFRTAKAAEKAANDGCPRCGGVAIDLHVNTSDDDGDSCRLEDHLAHQRFCQSDYPAEPDYGGAFDGFHVTSDADEGL